MLLDSECRASKVETHTRNNEIYKTDKLIVGFSPLLDS